MKPPPSKHPAEHNPNITKNQTMPRDTTNADKQPEGTRLLHIRIQNTNRSLECMNDILNYHPTDDIIAFQEPYIDHLNNSRATPHWVTVYPSTHPTDPRKTRSYMLVSKMLNTDAWAQLNIPHPDITAISLSCSLGTLRIFNLYNNCDDDNTTIALQRFLRANPHDTYDTQPVLDIWAGDFNRHHIAWELPTNTHLIDNNKAHHLLTMIDIHRMTMVLPPALPTLKALNTKNLTRPDNIFVSQDMANQVMACKTCPELRPPRTDHFPIFIEIDINPHRQGFIPKRNYRGVNWEELRDALREKLMTIEPPAEITSIQHFDQRLVQLTDLIHDIEDEHVPMTKDTPYRNWWWTPALKDERKNVRQLAKRSWRLREWPYDPVHQEYRTARNRYGDSIKQQKANFWMDWLEGAVSDGADMWQASKMVMKGPSDGGRARIPTLNFSDNTGHNMTASTNATKATILHKTFFPPPPITTNTPPDPVYPEPAWTFQTITNHQVERVFCSMKPHKATYTGSLHNDFMRHTSDLIAPFYAPLYRATFVLEYYPATWKETETIVLRKPNRTSYHNPNSWRPIVLSKGEARALNKCIAEDLSWGCEAKHLLPTEHYGGHPGRRATDAVMAMVAEVKNAWRKGKVATAIFLDVKGAYPSTDVEMLQHEMRLVGIPVQYAEWLQQRMEGRTTTISFDGHQSKTFDVENGLDQGDPASGILYSLYNAGLAQNLKPKQGEHGFLYIDDNTILAIGSDFQDTHNKCADMLQREDGPFQWATSHNCEYSLPKFQALDLIRPSAGEDRKRGKGEEITVTLNNKIHKLQPRPVAKWLGLLMDEQLRWKAQIEVLKDRGKDWVNKF